MHETSQPSNERLAAVALRLLEVARQARAFHVEGNLVALGELLRSIRAEADEAAAPESYLWAIAEEFLRTLSRTDLGDMELALHRFGSAFPEDAESLFTTFAEKGRVQVDQLERLPSEVRNALDLLRKGGCVHVAENGALVLRPSLLGVVHDLVAHPMFRAWCEVQGAREKASVLVSEKERAVALASLLRVGERDALMHLRKHPVS
jgi:hypothetical protein